MRQKTYHQEGQALLFEPESDWTPPGDLPELSGKQCWDVECWDPELKTVGPGWYPGGPGYIAGLSVTTPEFTGYFPIRHEGGGNIDPGIVLRWAKSQIAKPGPKIFARAQYDIGWLGREGIKVAVEDIHDVQIQAPLLDENRHRFGIEYLAKDFLGLEVGKDAATLDLALKLYGFNGDRGKIAKVPARYVGRYAEGDSRLTMNLFDHFAPMIEEQELRRVYDLERSLVPVLLAMRMRGAPVNLDYSERLLRRFRDEQKNAIAELKHLSGVFVEPWAAQTVAAALRTEGIECAMTGGKHPQPSVTAEFLEGLAGRSKIARLVLRARKLDKAAGTFIENYILNHQRRGRIHATFEALRSDEGGTVSGRFASNGPNLQNIPKRDAEIGPLIRAQFVGEEGELFASADYSAQEPRLTVHWAVVAGLRGSFEARDKYRSNPKTDYHQMVADMCGISRKAAKAINLGLAYGMGGPKLCRQLGLPTEYKVIKDRETGNEIEIEVAGPEGQALLTRYDENAPFIKKLFNLCSNRVNSRGFIKTLFGRRCRFEKSVNGKYMFTHKAMNRLIQGSAADQTKEAMRQLYYDHGVVPLMTVHDELCFSVRDEAQAREYAHIMEHAVELEVPVIADVKVGPSWSEKEEEA